RSGGSSVLALGAAHLLNQLELGGTDVADAVVGKRQRLNHDVFADFLGASFNHGDRVGGAGNDHLKVSTSPLFIGRVDHQLVADQTNANRTNRAVKRQTGQQRCNARAVHGANVWVVATISRQHVGDDL